jgi:hypothetical protein
MIIYIVVFANLYIYIYICVHYYKMQKILLQSPESDYTNSCDAYGSRMMEKENGTYYVGRYLVGCF